MNREVIHYEDDLKALLRLMMQLGEALKGRKGDKLAVWAEPLTSKAIGHAYSILFLFRGTYLEDERISFVDHASILVLARALAESVLTFDYLFVEPSTQDEREFRYCTWALAGIAQRQQFPALTPRAKEQLAKDKSFLADMRARIEQTDTFRKLQPKDQNRVLSGEYWKVKTLVESLTKASQKLVESQVVV